MNEHVNLEEQLQYAEYRWLDALRNETDYDAMYWLGVIHGLKTQMAKREEMQNE